MRTKAFLMTTTLALLGLSRAGAQPAGDLFPAEPGVNTERGFAVALDGDLLAVGAPLDDQGGPNAGAVYVFRWETTSWEQEAKLTGDGPPVAGPASRFGSAVALRDGVLAVGALGEGAVYVFLETERGWSRRAKFRDPAGSGAGTFGRAVAVDGGRLAVGAVNPHGRAAGAVYLYTGAAAPRRLSSAQPRERFGEALALAGELLVVGAPGHSRQGATYAGAAHVFRLSGGAPVKIARLAALDGRAGDQLGAAVATDGTTVVLGAPTADGGRSNSGAIYAATCGTGACGPPHRLAVAEPAAEAMLGFSVAVDEDLLAAGEHGSALPDNPGRLRVFRGSCASWIEEPVPLPANVEGRDVLGFAVALDGARAVAGAVLGDQGGAAAGAVWSFFFEPEEGWREEAEAVARDPLLRPDDREATARFGVSMAAAGRYLVVGALREPEGPAAGAVYVYRRAGLGWRQEARLTSPAGEDAPDGFGTSVATDGASLLVAAPFASTSDLVSPPSPIPPTVYLYSRSPGGWRLEAAFRPTSPSPEEVFGAGLAVEGDVVAVGAPSPVARGGVYLAERQAGEWSYTAFRTAPGPAPGDGFGAAVALRQGVLAIGAPGTPPGELILFSRQGEPALIASTPGAVYVVRRQEGVWSAPLRLPTPSLSAADRLGTSVALGDGVLAAGAPGRQGGKGAVLVYRESAPSWSLEQELVGTGAREFGASVAVLGDRLAVGAPGDAGSEEPGRAFLFETLNGWVLVAEVRALRPAAGDLFGTAVALTDRFLAVTQPGSTAGDRLTLFTLRHDEAAEEK